MKQVDVTVYYLQMLSHRRRIVPEPREDLRVEYVEKPSVPYYRSLYNSVGKDYYWLSRRKMSDAELAATLAHPRNEVHVLHARGRPAGFVEFDRRSPKEIEIIQFGLVAEFIGQGLGKWFLQWAIDKAWQYKPMRLWLHTCSLDHPAALPNYRKAGFQQYKVETICREL